ncbi:succinate dehydrogenase cytochrome b560 subunit [Aspergillus lucknowensis]|uniref:Succinate dehydrogenase cytochrome b560 subunit n=1 Tax=Aspergillus lucknowensis TaxID=176173 RepID=A0ABR4LNY5_9EURO
MLSQKVAQQSLRRLAVQQPYAMRWSLMTAASPVAVVIGRNIQTRYAATSTNTTEPTKLLAEQRLRRPVSPHLTIYRPQITWYGSAVHRITGLMLSGPLYLWATAYLASPLLGWHLESASMAAAFGALPLLAKVGLKGFFAWPFTYHCLNGLRHLMWDLGRGITNKQVIQTGWTVVGASAAAALFLALL